jgi:hypothetical protein
MTMTSFSDQLFTDLMREHGSALQTAELMTAASRRHQLRRGAWLAGGAGTLAVGITAGLAAFGGTVSEAYAISPHSDGTVTVSISELSGVTGANTTLRNLGMRVVVVPVKAGCPSVMSLPDPPVLPGKVSGSASMRGAKGSLTVDARGIPAGDLLVIAASQAGDGTEMSARLTAPPAPACVTLPAQMPGRGHSSGGGQGPAGGKDPGGVSVRTGSGGGTGTSTAAG